MKKLIILIMFLFTFLNANANWELIYEDLITFSIHGNIIYVGTENGLFISRDNGDNWDESEINNVHISNIEFKNDYIFVFGYVSAEQLSYLFLSSDLGETWATKPRPHGTTVLVLDEDIFISSAKVMKSTDTGDTWETVGPGRVSTLGYNEGVIYAGTYGDMQTPCRMYISTDMGDTWEYKNDGLNDHDSERSYYNFYSKGDSVFAGGDFSTLYVTTNSDERWWKVSGIYSYYFKIWNEILFSSFKGGIDISYDYGITGKTKLFDTTKTNDKGETILIEIDENTNSIFALEFVWSSSIPNRLYRSSLDKIVSVQDQLIKTDEYEIFIYPQPASTQLTIVFDSSMDLNTKISLNDLSGKEVLSVNYDYFVGNKSIFNIDTSSLISGSYFLIFQIGDNIHSKIISIIK